MKRLEREADNLFPSSVEVENAWSYTFSPQYVFMVWCLVKLRSNFTFTLLLEQTLRHPQLRGYGSNKVKTA